MSNSLLITLSVVAFIVIAALAGVAAYYVWQVKKQNAQLKEEQEAQKKAWREKKEELAKDIRFIAHSMVQQQCEITEGCMRIKVLMDHLDGDLQFKPEFKTIQQVFSLTSDMPTHQAYKDLNRKEQFKLDNKRYKIEDEHRELVLAEAKTLVNYQFDILNLH